MVESSWPSPSNGRVIDDVQYEKLGIGYGAQGGILGDFTSPQLIYADSTGMQIKVAADRYALVRGHTWWSGSSIVTKAIASNSSGSLRVDSIVLRLSRTTWDVNVVVIQGTPGAGTPNPTSQSGTTGVWDLWLATVQVANGAATITAGNVNYVAPHLDPHGGGLRTPNSNTGGYIANPFTGMELICTDGTTIRYNGSGWVPALELTTQFARKAANQSVTNSTTLVADSDLTFSVNANATYHMQMSLLYEGTTAADLKILMRCPTGATFAGMQSQLVVGMAGQQDDQISALTENATNAWGSAGAGVNLWGRLEGTLLVGSTAGTFRLEWAQNAASATPTIVKAGSFMIIRRVA